MTRIHFAYLLALVSLFLSSCNNDEFIKKLEVTPESSEMGPDKLSEFLKVKGEGWLIVEVNYYDGSEYHYSKPEYDNGWHDNVLRIVTYYSSLSIEKKKDGVAIKVERCLAGSPASLYIAFESGYQRKSALVTIKPTGTYKIEITDVTYNLSTWSGYTEKDYSCNLYTVNFGQGLSEPTDYTFAPISKLPVVYSFTLRCNENEFRKQVLESGIRVPFPEYAWMSSINTPEPWALLGVEVPLSSLQSVFDTFVMIPQMPAPVKLPSGKPLEVRLNLMQECVGLDLDVTAVNPATRQSEVIPMELIMYKPQKFTTEVILK